jgi:hypothetical protein
MQQGQALSSLTNWLHNVNIWLYLKWEISLSLQPKIIITYA